MPFNKSTHIAINGVIKRGYKYMVESKDPLCSSREKLTARMATIRHPIIQKPLYKIPNDKENNSHDSNDSNENEIINHQFHPKFYLNPGTIPITQFKIDSSKLKKFNKNEISELLIDPMNKNNSTSLTLSENRELYGIGTGFHNGTGFSKSISIIERYKYNENYYYNELLKPIKFWKNFLKNHKIEDEAILLMIFPMVELKTLISIVPYSEQIGLQNDNIKEESTSDLKPKENKNGSVESVNLNATEKKEEPERYEATKNELENEVENEETSEEVENEETTEKDNNYERITVSTNKLRLLGQRSLKLHSSLSILKPHKNFRRPNHKSILNTQDYLYTTSFTRPYFIEKFTISNNFPINIKPTSNTNRKIIRKACSDTLYIMIGLINLKYGFETCGEFIRERVLFSKGGINDLVIQSMISDW